MKVLLKQYWTHGYFPTRSTPSDHALRRFQLAARVLQAGRRFPFLYRFVVRSLNAFWRVGYAPTRASLFDSEFYLTQNPEAVKSGVNPLLHYLASGAAEGCDPHPLFDSGFYLRQNPDLSECGTNPLVHYLTTGAKGRSNPHPLFDSNWYLAQKPKVGKAGSNPLLHYLKRGAAEGRDPHPLFDSGFYLKQNPDLSESGTNPLVHYLSSGAAEGCDPHPSFDSDWYLAQNPAVAEAKLNPLVHYVLWGRVEGKSALPVSRSTAHLEEMQLIESSGLFDAAWYLSHYPDVANKRVDPLEHFLSSGAAEGRSPGPQFDACRYLRQNRDVRESKLNPLLHYLRQGRSEGRTACDPIPELLRGTSAKIFSSLVRYEPEVFTSAELNKIPTLVGEDGQSRGVEYEAFRNFIASIDHPYDRMILLPWLTEDQASVFAINALKATVERNGIDSTLVVITDLGLVENASSLEGGHLRILPDNLSDAERGALVAKLIHAIKPQAVLNVNSRACWEAISRWGTALSLSTKFFAALFGTGCGCYSRLIGYSDLYFRRCLPVLEKAYVDANGMRQSIFIHYQVPPSLREKIEVLHKPVTLIANPPVPKAREQGVFKILWAVHVLRRKDVELLQKIMELSEEVYVDIYGCDVSHESNAYELSSFGSRVAYLGQNNGIDNIFLQRYAAFLHAELGDRVSQILFSAAAAGVPIVTSDVGNSSELVDSETGWLIENQVDSGAYLAALDQIRSDPGEAQLRAQRMIVRLSEQYSWPTYIKIMASSPSFLD